METELLYAIALRRCQHVGNYNYRKLVETFGSAKNVWELPKSNLKNIYGIGNKRIEDIGNPHHLEFAQQELDYCHKNEITIHTISSENYPFLLSQCPDAPSILYSKGTLPKISKNISIVGTRKMTNYGKQFINDFLKELSKISATTISGLAYGVDAQVHEKSLELNLPTIAVLAHGLKMIYPAKHKPLAEKIISNGGAIISEYAVDTKPERENFLQRNRIIAGLSLQTIIVESAYGGGSMNTANYACDYNRDVFALPGKMTDKYSQGCNMLISQNKAQIIQSTTELLENCFPIAQNTPNLFDTITYPAIENQEHLYLYQIISSHISISFDKLLTKTSKNPQEILSSLLEMELLGYITSDSARNYSC